MRLRFAPLAAAAAVAIIPVAQAQSPKGDAWDITSQMQMPGMQTGMPANTQRVCTAKGQAPLRAREGCRITDQQKLPNGWSWKMVCSDGSSADGSMTYQGTEAWSGVMNMKMKEGAMSMKLAGKRAGECDVPASTGTPKK